MSLAGLMAIEDPHERVREISRRLDAVCPARTRPFSTPEPCTSCGHVAGTCNDDCC